MQQKVAEFAANLLMAGVPRGRVAEMGYDYAVSLQTDALHNPADGMINITSKLMLKASEIIRDAMPSADKIHHKRCMVKPIAPTLWGQIRVDPEAFRKAFRKSEDE